MTVEKSLKRNIFFFYLLTFLFDVFRSSFFGIGSLFYIEKINLEIHHIFIIKLFTPIIITFFEIPSGIIGDKLSRKLSFILSCLFCAIGFLGYYNSYTLIHCIISEIFYSIGIAFQTGSLDALIISQMKEANISINSLLSKSFALRNIALILGGSIGILISYRSMRLFWLFGSLGMILTTLLTFWSIEEKKINRGENKEDKRKYFLDNFNFEIISNKNFIVLTIISISLSLVNAPFFNYWHTFIVKELAIPRNSKEYIIIYFLYNLLISVGSLLAPVVNNSIGRVKTLFISLYLIIIPTILMVLTKNTLLSISMFLATELGRGLEGPTFFNLYNSIIPNESRSLLLSINSMVQRFTSIISLAIFSYLSYLNKEQIGGKFILVYSSIVAIILLSITIFYLKEKGFSRTNE